MTALAIPILTARAGRINDSHRRAIAAGQSMLAHAIEAGRELIEVKAALRHGEFGAWCAANLGFAYSTAREYMRAAKSAPEMMDLHQFDGSLRAMLDSIAEKRPQGTPDFPTLDQSTAQRILKLARMANGGNEHEEAVAQEMLDNLAERFGMSGEEAQSAAAKLCPEPPSHDELVRRADEFNARLDERIAAIREEIDALIQKEGLEDALTIVAETVCRLKFPKEYKRA